MLCTLSSPINDTLSHQSVFPIVIGRLGTNSGFCLTSLVLKVELKLDPNQKLDEGTQAKHNPTKYFGWVFHRKSLSIAYGLQTNCLCYLDFLIMHVRTTTYLKIHVFVNFNPFGQLVSLCIAFD